MSSRTDVRGPCWANSTLIESPALSSHFIVIESLLDHTSVLPKTPLECRLSCLKYAECFVWVFLDSSVKPIERLKSGCNFRGLGSGVQSNSPGITSGYKHGNPLDDSCGTIPTGQSVSPSFAWVRSRNYYYY